MEPGLSHPSSNCAEAPVEVDTTALGGARVLRAAGEMGASHSAPAPNDVTLDASVEIE